MDSPSLLADLADAGLMISELPDGRVIVATARVLSREEARAFSASFLRLSMQAAPAPEAAA